MSENAQESSNQLDNNLKNKSVKLGPIQLVNQSLNKCDKLIFGKDYKPAKIDVNN